MKDSVKYFYNTAGLDPTECGSLLAALRCTRPAPAVSKPCGGAVLSLDPCRGEADWRCRDCGADYSCQYVVDTVRGLDIIPVSMGGYSSFSSKEVATVVSPLRNWPNTSHI